MATVVMYCTQTCPYCALADQLLARRGATVEKIDISGGHELFAAMQARTGRDTVPQIFIGDTHVGGYDDLVDLDMEGGLEPLLE
ncbi:MAG TPA: glutaredoxin 3 [Gammaproteobacteria bacterium]|nr:glutaredoxin 3 [Gammaproteobacteria bacterium]